MSKDKAADYFARHKESNECHITSDGRVFHSIGSASGFANTLKDNAVESFKRSEVAQPTNVVVLNTESHDKETRFKSRVAHLFTLGFERNEDLFSKEENGGTISIDATAVYEVTDEEFEIGLTPLVVIGAVESKNEALDALKNFDATVAGYPEIKALVKALGLDTENQKEATLVAALEAHKTAINLEVNA